MAQIGYLLVTGYVGDLFFSGKMLLRIFGKTIERHRQISAIPGTQTLLNPIDNIDEIPVVSVDHIVPNA